MIILLIILIAFFLVLNKPKPNRNLVLQLDSFNLKNSIQSPVLETISLGLKDAVYFRTGSEEVIFDVIEKNIQLREIWTMWITACPLSSFEKMKKLTNDFFDKKISYQELKTFVIFNAKLCNL